MMDDLGHEIMSMRWSELDRRAAEQEPRERPEAGSEGRSGGGASTKDTPPSERRR
jgi:hypothetical protein